MLFEDSNPKNLQVWHQSCFFVSGLLSHRIHVSFTINVGEYTIHGSYHYKVENTRAVLSFQAYYTNHWFQDPSFTLISSIRNGHRINRGCTSHHPHHVPRHSAVSSFDTLERTWTWTSQIFRPTIHKFHRDKNRKDGVPLQTNCRINAVSRRVAGKVPFWTCPNSLRNKSWNFEVDEICVCECIYL